MSEQDGRLRDFANIRKDYSKSDMRIDEFKDSPLLQMQEWGNEAISSDQPEPTAMVLSTISDKSYPRSRVVLLKGFQSSGFCFYTNYNSAKGEELAVNPKASALFFWAGLERQLRVEGIVEKLSKQLSDSYFSSRPRESQLGAWSSPQSKVLDDEDFLEASYKKHEDLFYGKSVPRPSHWGGYLFIPSYYEFWQGRPGRMHRRIAYSKNGNGWKIQILAP